MLPFCSYGIAGGTVLGGVAKLLPEKSLSRGLWIKGNALLSTFTGCLLGPFSIPSASIPLGVTRVLCPSA